MWPPPKLPREHGAWAMLSLPLILGVVETGPARATTWEVVASCVLAFLAHYALVPMGQRRLAGKVASRSWWLRRSVWGSFYLLSALAAFVATVVLTPTSSRKPLFAVAVLAAACATIFAIAAIVSPGRHVWSELIGMIGLALSPAMIALAAGAETGRAAFGPSILSYAYCVSSLSLVRAYEAKNKRPAATACVAVHVLLALGLMAAAGRGWLIWWAPVAFLPVLIRMIAGLVFPPATLRVLGFREIGVAVTYALLSSIALVS